MRLPISLPVDDALLEKIAARKFILFFQREGNIEEVLLRFKIATCIKGAYIHHPVPQEKAMVDSSEAKAKNFARFARSRFHIPF